MPYLIAINRDKGNAIYSHCYLMTCVYYWLLCSLWPQSNDFWERFIGIKTNL